ncbi:MAG: ATP synthase F1 subunit gamma [Planctomycetes bacterium]|nr:ATP synthase F1 subunit gamma [Planctomycetota bacterium]
MANARAIKNRIKTVTNTGKITKTMAMVSTAKATKAVTQIKNSRPYAERLMGQLEMLGSATDTHPLFQKNEGVEKTLLVVITSNRGLCGGYNANIIRLAKAAKNESTDVLMFGKKGAGAFRFVGLEMKEQFVDLTDIPAFEYASAFADKLIQAYQEGCYSKVEIIYSKYYSAGSQKPVQETLLPLSSGASDEESEYGVEPLFSPSKEKLLEALVPKVIRLSVFKYMLDAVASEHLARQLAMNSASDNASEMVKILTLNYNRARQAQITTELSEIVGGAEALK